MANKRQIHFLLKRFNQNKKELIEYLDDLCSPKSVKSISSKYGVGPTQVQRDRSNFTSRKINSEIVEFVDMK